MDTSSSHLQIPAGTSTVRRGCQWKEAHYSCGTSTGAGKHVYNTTASWLGFTCTCTCIYLSNDGVLSKAFPPKIDGGS